MQKGFISLSLTGYVLLGMSVIMLALSVALKVQTARLDSAKSELRVFIAQAEAIAKQAHVKAREIEAKDKKRKEKADADIKKLRADNAVLIKRLRDNASRSFVPRNTATSSDPDKACFKQADIDAAIRRFTSGITELIIEGQDSIDDLDNAKVWAKD